MLQSFNLAIKSIWSNKMRSFLTMLGIVIGVAAVIILVGLINGQMSYMKESFASMGTNQIMVNLVNLSTRSVSDDEMYGFYEENQEYFAQMSPTVSVNGTVKVGDLHLHHRGQRGVSGSQGAGAGRGSVHPVFGHRLKAEGLRGGVLHRAGAVRRLLQSPG